MDFQSSMGLVGKDAWGWGNERCEDITKEMTCKLRDEEDFAGEKKKKDPVKQEEFWKKYWGVYGTPASFTPPIAVGLGQMLTGLCRKQRTWS